MPPTSVYRFEDFIVELTVEPTPGGTQNMIHSEKMITLSPGREVTYVSSVESLFHSDSRHSDVIYINRTHPTRISEAESYLCSRVREWTLKSYFQFMKATYYCRHTKLRKVFVALRKWTIASKFLRSQLDVQSTHSNNAALKSVIGHTMSSMAKLNHATASSSLQTRCITPSQRQRKPSSRSTTPTAVPAARQRVQAASTEYVKEKYYKRSVTPVGQPLAGVRALASHPLVRQLARAQDGAVAAQSVAAQFGAALAKTSVHLPISEPVVQAPQFTRTSASPPSVDKRRRDLSPGLAAVAAAQQGLSTPVAHTTVAEGSHPFSVANWTGVYTQHAKSRESMHVARQIQNNAAFPGLLSADPQRATTTAAQACASPSAAEIAYAQSRGSACTLPSGSDIGSIQEGGAVRTIVPPKRARSGSFPVAALAGPEDSGLALPVAGSPELRKSDAVEERAVRGSKLQQVLQRFRGALTPTPLHQPTMVRSSPTPTLSPPVARYVEGDDSPAKALQLAATQSHWAFRKLRKGARLQLESRTSNRRSLHRAASHFRAGLLLLGVQALRRHVLRSRLQLVAVSHQSWRSNALTEAFWKIKRNVTRYNRVRFLSWRGDKFHRFVCLSRGVAALHLLVAEERARVYEEMLNEDSAGGECEGDSPEYHSSGSPRPQSPESEVSSLGEDALLAGTEDAFTSDPDQETSAELETTKPGNYSTPDRPELSPPPAPRPALNIAAVMLPSSRHPVVELDRPLRSTTLSPDNLILSPGSPSIDGSARDDQPDLNQTALHAVRDSDSELSMFLSSDSELSFESDLAIASAPAVGPPPASPPPGTPDSREPHADTPLGPGSADRAAQGCSPGSFAVAHPPYAFPFAEVLRESDAYRRRTLLLQGMYKLQQWVLRAQSADTMVEVLLQYRKARQLRVALNTLRAKALL